MHVRAQVRRVGSQRWLTPNSTPALLLSSLARMNDPSKTPSSKFIHHSQCRRSYESLLDSLWYPQGVPLSLGADEPSETILKLYDRRYLANTRNEFGDIVEYTSHYQQAYESYLKLSTLQGEDSKGIDFDDQEALAFRRRVRRISNGLMYISVGTPEQHLR